MILLALFLFLTGCGTMGNSRRWGEDATFTPGWSKIVTSACNAVTSPRFYVPAAAALLLSIGNADERVAEWVKAAAGRERPNKHNDKSFPSGHAANVAAFTNLASRNVDAMNIPQGAKTALDIGMYALTAATAWARVEAGAHYPTDVLAGMAQGYFITSFINDAFLGTGEDGSGGPVAGYDGRRLFIGYSLRF